MPDGAAGQTQRLGSTAPDSAPDVSAVDRGSRAGGWHWYRNGKVMAWSDGEPVLMTMPHNEAPLEIDRERYDESRRADLAPPTEGEPDLPDWRSWNAWKPEDDPF